MTNGAGMCGMSVEKIEEMRMTENKVKSDFPVDYIISMSKFFLLDFDDCFGLEKSKV